MKCSDSLEPRVRNVVLEWSEGNQWSALNVQNPQTPIGYAFEVARYQSNLARCTWRIEIMVLSQETCFSSSYDYSLTVKMVFSTTSWKTGDLE